MTEASQKINYLLQLDNCRMIKVCELMRQIAAEQGEWQKQAKAVIRELDGK